MKSRIVVLATIGILAAFTACNQPTTSETSATATVAATPALAFSPAAMEVATPAAEGSEQIAEGGELVGKGPREEAQQAMAAGGDAPERGGEQLQETPAAPAPQSTKPATQPAPDTALEPPAQEGVADGAAIFKAKCKSCHGADARGDTAMGRKHSIPDLRSSVVQDQTDAELAAVIANGEPGGLSASAHKGKALTGDEIEDVIAYLRSIRM